jgi:(1->4)-alpha-D-glucan 1-alpha-D-glucosylmutase
MVLDIVPNHVGLVSPANPWWWDVLRDGPHRPYGRHLDIRGGRGARTTLPAGPPARRAARRRARRRRSAVAYEPPRPARTVAGGSSTTSTPGRCGRARSRSWGSTPRTSPERWSVLAADRRRLRAPARPAALPVGVLAPRQRGARPPALLRRHDLGAVRIEDPVVFDDVHAAVLPRVPTAPSTACASTIPTACATRSATSSGCATQSVTDCWIVVEKILERGEELRVDWPIDGTVGYAVRRPRSSAPRRRAAGPVLDELQADAHRGNPIDRDAMTDAAKRTALDRCSGPSGPG